MNPFMYADGREAVSGEVIKWSSGTLYLVCETKHKQTLLRLNDLRVAVDFNSDGKEDREAFTKNATFVCALPNIGEIIKNASI